MKRRFILTTSIFVFLSIYHISQAEISLYLDGSPSPSGMEFMAGEPLPTLGVYSNNYSSWHGYVKSTYFNLINGQVVDSQFIGGAPSITPYNEPLGYEITADGTLIYPGVQFTMDIYSPEGYGLGYITLWNDASVFDVPVDTLSIYQGGWPGYESSDVSANAGGPYQLFEGDSVMFDASDSTYTLWYEEGGSSTDNISINRCLPYWSINGVDIAFGLTPTISYDTLVNGLNLSPGIYDLTFELNSFYGYDTAMTTIQIVPEPCTLLLLASGMMFMCRRKS